MKLQPWGGAPSTWVGWVLSLGLYELWRRRNVLAIDGREIVAGHGIVSRHDRTLPLGRVQDVTVHRVLWWARVTVSTAGGGPGIVKAGPYRTVDAREFASRVRAVIADSHASVAAGV